MLRTFAHTFYGVIDGVQGYLLTFSLFSPRHAKGTEGGEPSLSTNLFRRKSSHQNVIQELFNISSGPWLSKCIWNLRGETRIEPRLSTASELILPLSLVELFFPLDAASQNTYTFCRTGPIIAKSFWDTFFFSFFFFFVVQSPTVTLPI